MHGRVTSTQWLTPAIVRIVLGEGDLNELVMPDATDAYINVAIPPAGAPYPEVFDPVQVKDEHDRSVAPARRRYTVRSWDPERHELTLDFIVHGADGIGGSWAAAAQPGDVLVFTGPAGGYRPDRSADWHLMIGDESALPAIAASLEDLPPRARALVRLVCDGADHEVPLPTEADVDLAWLHRGGDPSDGDLLPDAVRGLTFPAGRVHAFVHGEADEIRAIRRHLLTDREVPRAAMSCSPYWRRDMTDEAWRLIKRDYVAAMEADVA